MYTLPVLPYSYDALEPYIDARTMEIHYTKHHQTYVDNLNKALEKYPELFVIPLPELLKNSATVPEDIRTTVRNNGGGHENHSFFWYMMQKNASQEPSKELLSVIQKKFGSFEQFKAQFSEAAKTRFGSGWAWLVMDKTGSLAITSTANQDSPLFDGAYPILGLDVWEHAYYLKYQNKRVDYIAAWWHVINWSFVEERFNAVK